MPLSLLRPSQGRGLGCGAPAPRTAGGHQLPGLFFASGAETPSKCPSWETSAEVPWMLWKSESCGQAKSNRVGRAGVLRGPGAFLTLATQELPLCCVGEGTGLTGPGCPVGCLPPSRNSLGFQENKSQSTAELQAEVVSFLGPPAGVGWGASPAASGPPGPPGRANGSGHASRSPAGPG